METNIAPQNIQIEVVVKGPGAIETELVVAGFFTLIENEALIGGAKQLNDLLKGKVMEYRTNGDFSGSIGDSFLFTPEKNTISGEQVLLIGLGKREEINLEIVYSIGALAMSKAHETGVKNFAFAPEIRDAGITAFAAKDVAQAASAGILKRYKELIQNEVVAVTNCFMLAGQAHQADAQQGVQLAKENASVIV